jgi:hypothetical protein
VLKDNIKKINKAISGERMLERIREISCYHRIQASEGYRAAAIHCSNKLREEGIKSDVLYYAARNEQWYLTTRVFQEWRCRQAYCDLVLPDSKRIADYREDNLSIIQKSYACDYSSTPVDIVLLDRGCDKSAYEGIDIAGKIIFVRDNFNSYLDWAIEKGGAIGIITDHIAEVQGGRTRYDLLDIKKYNTFWWTKDNNDVNPFGFVLTPRSGDKLAEVCRKMRIENEGDSTKPRYPKAKCFVDSDFYDGSIENVSAILPGESSEEILITAHLCHPRSSANDNASGVAAAMEVLNTLRTLIDKGELPPLKRTIRILLIPEYTGLYAYLESIGLERSKIKAGINLDMVGGKQEKGYGPLTLSGLPRSTPSFVMDLAALILDELKKEVPGFSPSNLVPMFNSATAEFTSGSDNFILSDPSIGIPTPMLGQWPDMYYHTSGDTPEVISTYILSKSSTLAAAYAYTLATLSENDLPGIFGKAYVHMQEELTELQNRALRGELDPSRLADEYAHYTEYYVKACEDYLRFFSGEEQISVKRKITLETDRIRRSADDMLSHFFIMGGEIPLMKKTPVEEKYMYIPHRKYISPINQLAEYTESSDKLKEALSQYSKKYRPFFSDSYYAELLIQYYIDGKRTAAEIAENVIMDCHSGDIEAVQQYIQLLLKLDLIDYIE